MAFKVEYRCFNCVAACPAEIHDAFHADTAARRDHLRNTLQPLTHTRSLRIEAGAAAGGRRRVWRRARRRGVRRRADRDPPGAGGDRHGGAHLSLRRRERRAAGRVPAEQRSRRGCAGAGRQSRAHAGGDRGRAPACGAGRAGESARHPRRRRAAGRTGRERTAGLLSACGREAAGHVRAGSRARADRLPAELVPRRGCVAFAGSAR